MNNPLGFDDFVNRHIGPRQHEIDAMLAELNTSSLDELSAKIVPTSILKPDLLDALPKRQSEYEFLHDFGVLARKNKVFTSYIGQGYYDTITPPVIQRNILENPGWYTAYTPYQAEIAQGRLEMLLNFQTMVMDLTGMELANASLLDEATAAAEAMSMFFGCRKGKKKQANVFFVSETVFVQTIAVLQTRAQPLGIEIEVGAVDTLDITRNDLFGLLVQYPDRQGFIRDFSNFFTAAAEQNVRIAVASDLLALTLLKSPGAMGADAVVGSAQRLGVPMGFGGPHAAFFATKEEFKRQIPGRIIGVSKDLEGNLAFRMALQTREQHIRRDKATSNICTAQVLLAVMSAAYAVYHGPEGLRRIAEQCHLKARLMAKQLAHLGYNLVHKHFFDTLLLRPDSPEQLPLLNQHFEDAKINPWLGEDGLISLSFDEAKTHQDLRILLNCFSPKGISGLSFDINEEVQNVSESIPDELFRREDYLTDAVFHRYRSEHDMLRYLKYLENKDLSLTHSMISLGSCTMKLNATTEMLPITWPEIANMHPFAPNDQVQGYSEMIANLGDWLRTITGFSAISLQPNSGAQGEYTGLMTIRAYHQHRGALQRKITLIPQSAHGTNPASAVMAGMRVVVIDCDEKGNISLNDLRQKAEAHANELAALMVTYPSTHGVFESDIKEICKIIHQFGGLVYMDGANMNAQVGLTSPAEIGADVCHLNLHKTFCIPHGGGGPGMGPIGVNEKLAPFLPQHPFMPSKTKTGISPVSAALFGSASILPISYAYIRMMGSGGLKQATQVAILNANYLRAKLDSAFEVLFTGEDGFCAHEFIIDLRPFKQSAGVEVEDIAKRLMDYGFHAPTVSFPVPGTMMIEPTESESKEELDRFIRALLSIRDEIQEIVDGKADRHSNVLKNAPHTASLVTADAWDFPYSRQKATFPLEELRLNKFWPSVRRIDNAYGDRNLICSCAPIEAYV